MRGGRGASPEARGSGVVAAHKRHARGKGPAQGLGAKGTRGAHSEHAAHVCDAGGVEAQRLVEGRRGLPSRREGMRCGAGEVRAGRREGLWCGGGTQEACTGMAQLKAWGSRARAERTENTPSMVVTLEVSQPEMSALKFVKLRKRLLMSVMAETSQSATGPHVAVVAVGLALNSWSLVCREALVVKTQGGEDGDGGGGDEDCGGGLGLGDGGLGGLGDGAEGDGGGGEGDGGGGLGDGGDGDSGNGLGDGGGGEGEVGSCEGGGSGGGDGASGGGSKAGDSLQTSASSSTRVPVSSASSWARIALDESVAICSSVAELTLSPKPHANTVAPSPLTSAAASTAVSNSVLPGAASTVCSPSETSSTTFVAPTRPSSAKS